MAGGSRWLLVFEEDARRGRHLLGYTSDGVSLDPLLRWKG